MSEAASSHLPSPSGDFYRLLCQHASVAILATDAEFRIVCWNAAAERLLGAAAADRLGRHMDIVVPEGRRKLLRRLLKRTITRGGTSQFEIRLPGPGGAELDLLITLSPIPAPGGQAQGVAAWIIDETRIKRLDERLTQAEKIASLGTLAGGVAHHFNNILGGVATFVDFALTRGDAASMKRALQMTAEAAARAAKITQSLLSFADSDPGRHDMSDLTEVVLTFAHLVERPLAEKGIRIQLDLKPVPLTPVEGHRMNQVLGHLLNNAEEAMPAGGVVTVGLDRAGGEAVLAFADTGCGIEPRHLPLVFEPFFTTKGLLAGGDKANPGLGLSIVHGVVTAMGGHVEVQSEPGRWTRVTIRLPLEGAVQP